ncbi:unnamed protein product [Spirodela intermedia]|uniref:Uncharacterized protein n=2 Tax=Spirodela intermedia TaxID=51605 RepID=A0A7I8II39_SPIIN|nr:unnamed protein product [Spirodela intermedia]CAA6657531.1 unnamed protein product [Spirodela intermedia]CAA7393605.1 unnamed protein product [Spirodela intermedia]
MGADSSSSSGEEDGDAVWRAAIDSVAAVDFRSSSAEGRSRSCDSADSDGDSELDDEEQMAPKAEPRALKLYQIKAQKLIDDILDRSLVMVRDPTPTPSESLQMIEGGVRLFTKSSRGIVLHSIDRHPQLRERPRITPGEEIDEKSKKFKRRVHSASVDGNGIIASASSAHQQALVRSEARDAARRAANLCEEERVAKLKKLRGEKWLPSLAREMKVNRQSPTFSMVPQWNNP